MSEYVTEYEEGSNQGAMDLAKVIMDGMTFHEHDRRSVDIFEAIAEYDYALFSDYFCFKRGGDGDNGEVLLTELDLYFYHRDERGRE